METGGTAMETGRVAIVKCCSYDRAEVEAAVEQAVELLGGIDKIL